MREEARGLKQHFHIVSLWSVDNHRSVRGMIKEVNINKNKIK